MDPGKLNTPIEILRRVAKKDAANESIDEWGVFARPRASIVFQSGYAAIRDGRESYSTMASIAVYRIAGLLPTMLISANLSGEVMKFNIESVSYLDNNRYISMACRRIY